MSHNLGGNTQYSTVQDDLAFPHKIQRLLVWLKAHYTKSHQNNGHSKYTSSGLVLVFVRHIYLFL